eukprot:475341-Prorocentrum_minimum.AAC.1
MCDTRNYGRVTPQRTARPRLSRTCHTRSYGCVTPELRTRHTPADCPPGYRGVTGGLHGGGTEPPCRGRRRERRSHRRRPLRGTEG